MRIVGEDTRRLARQAAVGDLPEAEAAQGAPDLSRLQLLLELDHADVRGLGQHRGQVHGAEISLVPEDTISYLNETWIGVEEAVGAEPAGGKPRSDNEGLDARARLEQIRDRAVAILGR